MLVSVTAKSAQVTQAISGQCIDILAALSEGVRHGFKRSYESVV